MNTINNNVLLTAVVSFAIENFVVKSINFSKQNGEEMRSINDCERLTLEIVVSNEVITIVFSKYAEVNKITVSSLQMTPAIIRAMSKITETFQARFK